MAEVLVVYSLTAPLFYLEDTISFTKENTLLKKQLYCCCAFVFICHAQRHNSSQKVNIPSEDKNLDPICRTHFFPILFSTEAEKINKLQYFKLSLLQTELLIGLKSSSETPR